LSSQIFDCTFCITKDYDIPIQNDTNVGMVSFTFLSIGVYGF